MAKTDRSGDPKSRRSFRVRKPAWGKIALIALVIAVLTALWRYSPLAEWITPHRLLSWARATRETTWAPTLLVLAYTPAAFIMFPRPLLTLTAVIAFGAKLGLLYAMAGILGATLATYYAGRLLKYETVRRLAGDKLDTATKTVKSHTLLAVFAASIVPTPPFVIQGIMAGAMRINVWPYTAGTLLGMLPGVLTATLFGGQIATALEDPAQMSFWLIGVAVVLVITTYVAGRWFAKQQQK
jgi:phospholipase D1/2